MGNPDMTHAKAQAALLEEVAEARKQGKMPLSGEHIFNVLKQPLLHAMHRDPSIPITHFGDNPTHIPDEIWQTLRPIILIRHPVPHITSGYASLTTLSMSVNVGDEDLEIFCSQRYYRYVRCYRPCTSHEAFHILLIIKATSSTTSEPKTAPPSSSTQTTSSSTLPA
jgi:hypothetical protein